MMGWSIGWDDNWKRDIGYGVPSLCDHPECSERIDRGLSYVCGNEPKGGEHGCGLYFCGKHLFGSNNTCIRCFEDREAFEPKPDLPEWTQHKMTHESWAEWRKERL